MYAPYTIQYSVQYNDIDDDRALPLENKPRRDLGIPCNPGFPSYGACHPPAIAVTCLIHRTDPRPVTPFLQKSLAHLAAKVGPMSLQTLQPLRK